MKVGDVVVATGDFQLVCGSGRYSHAIVASVDPLVLVSEHGDMLWRSTVNESNVRALCQAHPDIVAVAIRRLQSGY
jgi:hypothetical protein